jgi:hypothetical protein
VTQDTSKEPDTMKAFSGVQSNISMYSKARQVLAGPKIGCLSAWSVLTVVC